MPEFDFMIVGSGFFGATFARKATDAGKKCLVIDKNNHIAGATYDRKWDNGIIVSEYGAHIFHTQSEEVWDFINKFTTIMPFTNKPKVLSKGNVYSFPINMMTLHQLWGVINPEEAYRKLQDVRIPCENPRNFEEWALDRVGKEIYELFFYGYTKKQWMKEPRDLPASIIQRLPIRLTYEENYFTTKYQGIPNEGYSATIKNMLDGIKTELNTDFFTIRNKWRDYAKHLIYTGPIDKFYDYEFGSLEYNTLRFEHKKMHGDYQGNAVFNHVDMSVPHIRTIEHKHFYKNNPKHYEVKLQSKEETVVSYDIPVAFKDHPEPYYPIRDDKNSELYNKYADLKTNHKEITFGGRLGEYKYLDIDQTIASALTKFKTFV
jgi:UDP-galactopyranose mutase